MRVRGLTAMGRRRGPTVGVVAVSDEPAYDLEAERALLGAIFLDPRMMSAVSPFDATWFWREAHRWIWRALSDLYAAGDDVDLITVAHALEARGQLEKVGGRAFMVGLFNAAPVALNAGHYANIVRGLAATRESEAALRLVLQELRRHARDPEKRSEAIAQAASKTLEVANRMQPHSEKPTLQTMGDTFAEVMFELEHASKGQPQKTSFVSTGIIDGLDIPVGLLSLLAGPPRTGKSILFKQIVKHWAADLKLKPHVINIEDHNKNMAHRMLATETGVEPYRIRQLLEDPLSHPDAHRDYVILMEACARLMSLEGTWNQRQGVTVEDIALDCYRAYHEDGARAFALDIATRIQFTPGSGNTALEKTNHIIKQLCNIPAALDAPFLVTLHINREGQKASKPSLYDLRDSGNWENFARWVVLTHADKQFLSNSRAHPASLIHAKQTHGPTLDEIPMVLDKPRMMWRQAKISEGW